MKQMYRQKFMLHTIGGNHYSYALIYLYEPDIVARLQEHEYINVYDRYGVECILKTSAIEHIVTNGEPEVNEF